MRLLTTPNRCLSVLACIVGTVVVSCGGGGSTTPDPPISTTYQVTYKPKTVVVDKAAIASGLKDISSDGTTFTLASSTKGVDGLSKGTVLVLSGVALVKVTSVTKKGDSIEVATEPAALTDAIQEGTIQWEQEMASSGAGSGGASFPQSLPDGLRPLSGITLSPNGGTYSGTLSGYKYTVTIEPTTDQVEIDVTVTFTDAGLEMKIEGDGTISGFRSSGDIEVHQGIVQKALVTARNLSGDFKFHWVAGKPKPKDTNTSSPVTLKFPVKWTKTIPVDGIPFIVSVGGDLSFQSLLSGGNATSEAIVDIPFSGTVTLDGTGGGKGSSGNVSAVPSISSDSSTFALVPSGFAAAMSFPDVGLGLGFTAGNVMMSTELITSGTSQTPGGVAGNACEKFDFNMEWEGKVTAALLGITVPIASKTFYKDEQTMTVPSGASCD